ncbi:MAG: bifunctional diaminohydroxyphosphoribosylaminopyrimidine deaminase/5-amino-6-(5-phosphoribosylamino)uracil reductase RibD [Acidimicrobiales bacterium]
MRPTDSAPSSADDQDVRLMRRAIALAAGVRTTTSPNPWVGSVVVPCDVSSESAGADSHVELERCFEGATSPPGGPHAEVAALAAAGDRARGSTLYTTLEPCSHHGRTSPCTDAIVEAGVSRVVVGLSDPDPSVDGHGVEALRRAGIEVTVGVAAREVEEQLAAYLTHRRTGRPLVVLKLAATMDGRIAAPDGSSRWITGPDSRRDAHELRRMSDAVLVGAATVRSDDPELTVRNEPLPDRQPLRVVLGSAPAGSRVLPAVELSGDPASVLDELGGRGVLQLLVEGGATVAAAFHRAQVVDRYVLYLAPAFFGGDDAVPLFAGPGAPTIEQLWRGRVVSVERLGDDVRLEIAPGRDSAPRAA